MSKALNPLTAAIFVWASLAYVGIAVAGDEDQLAKVLETWRLRQARTSAVRYSTKGEHVIAKGRYNKNKKGTVAVEDLPDRDLRFEKKVTWLVDFKNNWIRKESDSKSFDFSKKQLRPFFAVDVFDGTTMIRSTPREKNTNSSFSPSERQADIQIKPEEYEQFFLLAPDYPIFMAHGNVPTIKNSPSPKQVKIAIDTRAFVVHRKAILDERECVVLRSGAEKDVAFDEYWVDPSRESVILRWARYRGSRLGGKLWAQLEVKYQQQQSGWLPKSWTLTHYNSKDTIETTEQLDVVAADINPSFEIDQFRITPSSGQIVEDMPQKKLSRVDRQGVLRELEPAKTGDHSWYWIAALVAIAIAFVAGTALRKFYRRQT